MYAVSTGPEETEVVTGAHSYLLWDLGGRRGRSSVDAGYCIDAPEFILTGQVMYVGCQDQPAFVQLVRRRYEGWDA